MDKPPVRFRIVLEVTFPDADPCDASEHLDYVDQFQFALETAGNVKCTDVKIREACSLGVADDYDEWLRGSFQYAFSTWDPQRYRALVDNSQCRVSSRMTYGSFCRSCIKTKTGELKENAAIAIGRAIKTDCDSNAILARAYVLRVLQAKKLVPDGFGEDPLSRAASIPLRSAPMNQSDLTTLAALFH